MTERKEAEAALRQARDDLELSVTARTAELASTDERLTQEIDDRKRTQVALEASDARYEVLAEAARDSISVLTRDGRIEYVNSFLAEQYGCDREDLVGQPLRQIFPPEVAARQLETIQTVCETGVPVNVEHVLPSLSGSSNVWIQSRVVPITEDNGSVTAVLGIGRDITDRKLVETKLRESEARFRAFAENSMVTIGVTEVGRFTYVNPRLEALTGYTQAELLAMEPADLVDPDAREDVQTQAQAVRRGDALPEVYEIPLVTKHGERRWVEVTSTRLELQGQSSLLTMGLDITERKQADAEVHQAQKMEVVGRLAGGVAHDFNNLLTVIIGHTALLMRGLSATDPQRRGLAAIAKAGDRGKTLTQQLLAFSRHDVVRTRVLNPNETVSQVQALLPRLLGDHIRVVVDLDPDVTTVRMDPDQLEQVLMNLAVNARDAMPDGGILRLATTNATLDAAFVQAHPGARPGAYVAVSVSDTGQGMDAATAAQVFEPFYTTKARGKGTGLGLATVYGIVKQAEGYVALETAPGRGATFAAYFPQVDAAEETVAAPPSLAGLVRGTETVLVVEDEDDLRALLDTGLSDLGYTVLTACGGPEALELCGGDVPVDVLLTDVVMPDMNGASSGSV